MATHSSILAWDIPGTEEPGQAMESIESQRVGYDLATKQKHKYSIVQVHHNLFIYLPVDGHMVVSRFELLKERQYGQVLFCPIFFTDEGTEEGGISIA